MAPQLEIIAEIGVNHNGDAKLAMQLVEAAANAGATTAKFQVFKTEHLVTRGVGTAEYQRLEGAQNQFELLEKLELVEKDIRRLKSLTESLGLKFLATPDDYPSLRFLVDELGVERLKVGSGEITNHRFLSQIGNEAIPLIVSTGMSTISEIHLAIDALGHPKHSDMVLLHCTTSYPTFPTEVNMYAFETMKAEFPYQIGYSDHSVGNSAALISLAMGSTVFEKHLTLDNQMSGPDHLASSDPRSFREYVGLLREGADMLGSRTKKPTSTELRNMPFVRRRVVSNTTIQGGELITEHQVDYLRAEAGLMAEEWRCLVRPRASRTIEPGTPLTSNLLISER